MKMRSRIPKVGLLKEEQRRYNSKIRTGLVTKELSRYFGAERVA